MDIPILKEDLLVKLEILGSFLCDRLPVSVKNMLENCGNLTILYLKMKILFINPKITLNSTRLIIFLMKK